MNDLKIHESILTALRAEDTKKKVMEWSKENHSEKIPVELVLQWLSGSSTKEG